ncbi:MAG: DUF1028 domain-containing protein [Candidatus Heimdallarchaeota archaeon]|nr:DUF1028 domain-containing protein [Candidatus Heimdallarchaeota archaeon]MBY8995818.1 DUF1028 domain-containing protein [Candidatus Heimdallarchaeota archaeon]
MTFSIVAFDKDANEVGFAISSCCWNAGSVCSAEAGKGVITHQAQGITKFHPIFFEQLKEKKDLEDILDHFRIIDDHIESRQIGFVSFEKGTSLAFTGKNCSFWAGHKTGENYACQGNILVGPEVINAMTHAFECTEGNLIDKLYAALYAGEGAGGDARGKQSARLLVKSVSDNAKDDNIVIVDFNIIDHEDPINEIGRLLTVRQNYREIAAMNKKFEQVQTAKERKAILVEILNFMKDKKESRYMSTWTNLGYAFYSMDCIDEAVYCYKTVFEISPTMVKTIKEAAKSVGVPDSVMKKIMEK